MRPTIRGMNLLAGPVDEDHELSNRILGPKVHRIMSRRIHSSLRPTLTRGQARMADGGCASRGCREQPLAGAGLNSFFEVTSLPLRCSIVHSELHLEG